MREPLQHGERGDLFGVLSGLQDETGPGQAHQHLPLEGETLRLSRGGVRLPERLHLEHEEARADWALVAG